MSKTQRISIALFTLATASECLGSRVSSLVSLDAEFNIRRPVEEDFSASTSVGAGLSYKLSKQLALGVQVGATKDLVDEQKFALADSQISAALKGIDLPQRFGFGVDLSINLPTSLDSRQRDHLRASITSRPKVSRSLDFLGLPESTVGAKIGLSLFNHKYTSTTYGKSNAAASVSMGVDFNFSLGAGLSIGLAGSYANSWTYEGSLVQAFNSSQSLDLEILSGLSASISHRNGGSLVRPDGVTSNIDLFSARSSFFGLGVSATF